MQSELAKLVRSKLKLAYSVVWSTYAFNRSSLRARAPLSDRERRFCLALRDALHGDNLVFYDVGAARGVLTSGIAKLANIQVVHAFEPIRSEYSILRDHTRNLPNVVAHNVALGRTTHRAAIQTSRRRTASSLLHMNATHEREFPGSNIVGSEPIQVVPLDEYVRRESLPMPDVVKLDVQGYEGHVLAGGEATVSTARFCIVEMSFRRLYDDAVLFDDVYQRLVKLGFRLVGLGEPLRGASGAQLQVDGIFENQA